MAIDLRPRSLAWIIIPALFVVQLLLFASIAWQSVHMMREMVVEQTRARLGSLQVELRAALVAPVLERDYSTLQEIVDELTRSSDLAYLVVRDSSGRVMASSGHETAIPEPDAEIGGHDDALFDTRFKLIQGEVSLGLRVAEVRQIFINFVQRTAPIVIVAGVLATIWMVLITLWIVRRLKRLTRAAESLGNGTFSVRAPEDGVDEVGRLGLAFNRMAVAVQSADEKWAKSQRFTDMLLLAMPMPVFYKDAQGRYMGCNDAFARVTGLSRRDIRGKMAAELWPAELAALHARHDEALHAGQGHQEYPGLLTDQHGQQRHVIFSKDVFYDEDGEIAGIIGAWNDISDLRRAEGRLQLLAGVFKHSREGIVIADASGRVVDVNRALCEISGYSRDEVVGQLPAHFYSGRHEPAFYQAIADTLQQQGHWQGEVWNRRKDGTLYPVLLSISVIYDQQGAVRHYIAVFADITVMKEQEARLDRMAHHDPLTQLPNRVLLGDRMRVAIAQAARSEQWLAICFMDLDGFKRVNDRYGHDVGDQLLIRIAERLQGVMRGGDTVARLGGDEFALLLSGLPDIDACHRSLHQVLETVAQPCDIGDIEVQVSASIGVTLYPQDEQDADTLLRHADQAMYKAKDLGRNGYQIFDAEHDKQSRSRLQSLQRLALALEEGELQLYYQPKVNMRDGQIVGMEALMRWHHPQRGVLPPGAFLPDVEDTHLDTRLGEWVIATALQQMAAWRGEGRVLSVSVNISAHHLQQPDFVERLAELLEAHPDVPRGMLEIEVLESTALSDIDHVSRLIQTCQALGVRFSLDDFGTGYSSLLYLKRLPADKLKIDQSFVRSMLESSDDLAIVQGIIGLSEAFSRELVAEGVETIELGNLLLHLGCDVAQGYGIAKPMPADEVVSWCQHWQSPPAWRQTARKRWTQDDIFLFGLELNLGPQLDRLFAMAQGGEARGGWDDDLGERFLRWYGTDGLMRYGAHPDYALLGQLQSELQQMSLQMWQALCLQDEEAVQQQLPSLLRLRQQHSQAVRNLLSGMPQLQANGADVS
jgi:diguanylate cyclase (GGDEF)-like protein/PAS domain S-box-containing protein